MTTPSPAAIRARYPMGAGFHFFDRDTMKFFGDRMTSFGSRTIDGQVYLYRKATAIVNVFGTRKRAGKEFFGIWAVGADGDLYGVYDAAKRDALFAAIYTIEGNHGRY